MNTYRSVFTVLFPISLLLLGACESISGIGPSPADSFLKLYGGDYSQEGVALATLGGGQGFVLAGHGNSFSEGTNLDGFLVFTDTEGNGTGPSGELIIDDIFDFSIGASFTDEYVAEVLLQGSQISLVGTTIERGGHADVFLVLADAAGNEVSRQRYGDSGFDEVATSAALMSNGDILIAGYTTNIDLQKGDYLPNNPSNSPGIELDSTDFWCLRVQADGTEVWEKTFGLRGADQVAAVQIIDDEIILAGTTDFPEKSEETAQSRDKDACLIRLNADGNLIDFQTFGDSESNEIVHGLGMLSTQDLVLVGAVSSPNSSENLWLQHVNEQFSPISNSITILDNLYSQGNSILELENGDWLITGTTANGSNGKTDISLLQMKPGGNIVWNQTFGSAEQDMGSESLILSSGEILLTGTIGFGNTPMMTLIKTDASGNLIQ